MELLWKIAAFVGALSLVCSGCVFLIALLGGKPDWIQELEDEEQLRCSRGDDGQTGGRK